MRCHVAGPRRNGSISQGRPFVCKGYNDAREYLQLSACVISRTAFASRCAVVHSLCKTSSCELLRRGGLEPGGNDRMFLAYHKLGEQGSSWQEAQHRMVSQLCVRVRKLGKLLATGFVQRHPTAKVPPPLDATVSCLEWLLIDVTTVLR